MRTMRFLALATAAAAVGCSSVASLPMSGLNDTDGVVYHLPRRDIQVTFTVSDGNISQITIGRTEAYADTDQAFLLRYQSNLIGENIMDIGVTAGGLLDKAHATTTPKVIEALDYSAETTGGIRALGSPRSGEPCTTDGTYVFVSRIPVGKEAYAAWLSDPNTDFNGGMCGKKFTLSIDALGAFAVTSAASAAGTRADRGSSGIYYRQSIPYLVKVLDTDKMVRAMAIVESPSAAATRFVPISATLFASNGAEMTLEAGELKNARQTSDGELTAFLKLPASILKAYFSAVGGIFAGFQSTAKAEADALAAKTALTQAKQKYKACLDALNAGQKELAEGLGCGSSP